MDIAQEFYDWEYYLSLEYRYFSRAHQRRINSLLEFLGQIAGQSILDFGGGAGHFGFFMERKGAQVTVADFSEAALAFGKTRFPSLNFIRADYRNLVTLDKTFPIITCFDVIEHLLEPKLLLTNLAALLEKGGKLFIATDNELCPFYTNPMLKKLDSYLQYLSGEGRDYALIKRVENYRRTVLAKDYHQSHIQGFSPSSLKELLEQTGWRIEAFKSYHLWSNPLKDAVSKILGKESNAAFVYRCVRR